MVCPEDAVTSPNGRLWTDVVYRWQQPQTSPRSTLCLGKQFLWYAYPTCQPAAERGGATEKSVPDGCLACCRAVESDRYVVRTWIGLKVPVRRLVMKRQRVGVPRPGRGRAVYRGPGSTRLPTLGVDVGGVIVSLTGRDEDTSFFGSQPRQTPAVAGVFDALAALAVRPFDRRIHLVSKAGPKVAANTRDWLAHHDFFDRTGIPADNLHFVRERRDKAPVCQRLGITHFIDDRLDVLAYLDTVEHRFLFTGGSEQPGPAEAMPAWARPIETWPDLTLLLHESIPDSAGGNTG